MKIGIITFHRESNHGAFLQAFGLMKYCEKLGHDVSIINYENKSKINKKLKSWTKYRHPIRIIDRIIKNIAFRKARNKFKLTKYTTDSSRINKIHFDVAIIGSDTVWNYKQTGFDEVYFGNVNANYKIAYAPSFGWVNLVDKVPKSVNKLLNEFDFISARDKNTQRIVSKICGFDPVIVLDPTFLFNYANYEEKIKKKYINKKYILIYAYKLEDNLIQQIKEYASKFNLSTIATGYRQNWCDFIAMETGPFDWISYIKNAALVITSTFHGTIFSIKYQKNFLVYLTDQNRNKVTSLLEEFELEERKVNKNNFGSLVNKEILYEKVNKIIDKRVEESENYLTSSLEKVINNF